MLHPPSGHPPELVGQAVSNGCAGDLPEAPSLPIMAAGGLQAVSRPCRLYQVRGGHRAAPPHVPGPGDGGVDAGGTRPMRSSRAKRRETRGRHHSDTSPSRASASRPVLHQMGMVRAIVIRIMTAFIDRPRSPSTLHSGWARSSERLESSHSAGLAEPRLTAGAGHRVGPIATVGSPIKWSAIEGMLQPNEIDHGSRTWPSRWTGNPSNLGKGRSGRTRSCQ
jgi:hypothetical protein